MISRRIESRKAAVGITLLGIDERPTSNVPNATGADGLPKNLPFRRLGVLGLALLLAGAEAGVEARWLSGAAAGAALRRGVEDMEMGMWSWNAARIGRKSRFLVAPNEALQKIVVARAYR
jgi:hypothetical protein